MVQEIRNKLTKVSIGFVLAMLAACSVTCAQDVTTNFMPGTNFSKYHSYKWITIEGASTPTRLSILRSRPPLIHNWQPRDSRKPTATRPISTSVTRHLSIMKSNGTPTAWAVVFAGAAVWLPRRARPSALGL